MAGRRHLSRYPYFLLFCMWSSSDAFHHHLLLAAPRFNALRAARYRTTTRCFWSSPPLSNRNTLPWWPKSSSTWSPSRLFTLPSSSSSEDPDEHELPVSSSSSSSSPSSVSPVTTGWATSEENDPNERFRQRQLTKRKVPIVGDPQVKVQQKERSVTSILKQLEAIQQQGPQNYCILGTRHCTYLHQQIIELLAYALVLSGNHVYTSGAGGTHTATIRGALRAGRPDLLTVVLPQSLAKQPQETQKLLHKVKDLQPMPENDDLSLNVASRICNSYLLKQADQLIAFAFHESTTVIEATKEAKALDLLVTVLYLD